MISYTPPADDYDQPRLLAPLFSLWLFDGDPIEISQFEIRRRGSTVWLAPTRDGLGKIRVNGELLSASHVLLDGDFIQSRHETYIFQSNPVGDRRERMLQAPDYQGLTVTPRQWLREQVDLNPSGLLLPKTGQFIAWQTIIRIAFTGNQIWPLNRYSISMEIYLSGRDKPAKVHLRFLKEQDFFDLLNWFSLVLPFDLSVANLKDFYGGNIRNLFPDAYLAAVYEKITRPAEEGKRTLPASSDVLSGFAPVIRAGQIWMGILSGGLGLALIVGLATQNRTVIVLSLLFSAYLLVGMLSTLADKWSRNRPSRSD
ncbi:MAG: hypothetical protein IPO91_06820 [Chloroflexi bacterium]|nr:hypothetical protein [Chloroflexota bacterium]